MREEKLLFYLGHNCAGREHRVSGRTLERALGIRGTDLRKLVSRLRKRGIPICSDRNGYFYAVQASEVYTTIHQLEAWIAGARASVQGLEQSLDSFAERKSP